MADMEVVIIDSQDNPPAAAFVDATALWYMHEVVLAHTTLVGPALRYKAMRLVWHKLQTKSGVTQVSNYRDTFGFQQHFEANLLPLFRRFFPTEYKAFQWDDNATCEPCNDDLVKAIVTVKVAYKLDVVSGELLAEGKEAFERTHAPYTDGDTPTWPRVALMQLGPELLIATVKQLIPDPIGDMYALVTDALQYLRVWDSYVAKRMETSPYRRQLRPSSPCAAQPADEYDTPNEITGLDEAACYWVNGEGPPRYYNTSQSPISRAQASIPMDDEMDTDDELPSILYPRARSLPANEPTNKDVNRSSGSRGSQQRMRSASRASSSSYLDLNTDVDSPSPMPTQQRISRAASRSGSRQLFSLETRPMSDSRARSASRYSYSSHLDLNTVVESPSPAPQRTSRSVSLTAVSRGSRPLSSSVPGSRARSASRLSSAFDLSDDEAPLPAPKKKTPARAAPLSNTFVDTEDDESDPVPSAVAPRKASGQLSYQETRSVSSVRARSASRLSSAFDLSDDEASLAVSLAGDRRQTSPEAIVLGGSNVKYSPVSMSGKSASRASSDNGSSLSSGVQLDILRRANPKATSLSASIELIQRLMDEYLANPSEFNRRYHGLEYSDVFVQKYIADAGGDPQKPTTTQEEAANMQRARAIRGLDPIYQDRYWEIWDATTDPRINSDFDPWHDTAYNIVNSQTLRKKFIRGLINEETASPAAFNAKYGSSTYEDIYTQEYCKWFRGRSKDRMKELRDASRAQYWAAVETLEPSYQKALTVVTAPAKKRKTKTAAKPKAKDSGAGGTVATQAPDDRLGRGLAAAMEKAHKKAAAARKAAVNATRVAKKAGLQSAPAVKPSAPIDHLSILAGVATDAYREEHLAKQVRFTARDAVDRLISSPREHDLWTGPAIQSPFQPLQPMAVDAKCQRVANTYGMAITGVAGDGNCFYNSILLHLETLPKAALQHLRLNRMPTPHELRVFISGRMDQPKYREMMVLVKTDETSSREYAECKTIDDCLEYESRNGSYPGIVAIQVVRDWYKPVGEVQVLQVVKDRLQNSEGAPYLKEDTIAWLDAAEGLPLRLHYNPRLQHYEYLTPIMKTQHASLDLLRALMIRHRSDPNAFVRQYGRDLDKAYLRSKHINLQPQTNEEFGAYWAMLEEYRVTTEALEGEDRRNYENCTAALQAYYSFPVARDTQDIQPAVKRRKLENGL